MTGNCRCAPARCMVIPVTPGAPRTRARRHARRRCVQSAAPGLAGRHRRLFEPLMPGSPLRPGWPRRLRISWLPAKLGFGAVYAPVMFSADWPRESWGRGQLVPVWAHRDPARRASAAIWGTRVRGMKAYRVGAYQPSLFRPHENWRRLARSAQRLSMPEVPGGSCSSRPSRLSPGPVGRSFRGNPDESLYLRPFLFGTEAGYVLRNSSTFRFMVIANPVEGLCGGPDARGH